jgi:hypothetical protein
VRAIRTEKEYHCHVPASRDGGVSAYDRAVLRDARDSELTLIDPVGPDLRVEHWNSEVLLCKDSRPMHSFPSVADQNTFRGVRIELLAESAADHFAIAVR